MAKKAGLQERIHQLLKSSLALSLSRLADAVSAKSPPNAAEVHPPLTPDTQSDTHTLLRYTPALYSALYLIFSNAQFVGAENDPTAVDAQFVGAENDPTAVGRGDRRSRGSCTWRSTPTATWIRSTWRR
eukprot:1178443-Prorocentrum_minimum.AAC.4